MTDISQLRDDVHFVRGAVMRRSGSDRGPASIYFLWAAYVLVGYTLIDFAPSASGWFFLAGGVVGGLVSWQLGKRWSKRVGQCDLSMVRRSWLHWAGGLVLSVIAMIALSAVIPPLRQHAYSGQVLVVLIGMVYFLAGVHFDRQLLWLGPVLMAGGVLVGLVPRYGWTILGAIIAIGLVLAALLPAGGAAKPQSGNE